MWWKFGWDGSSLDAFRRATRNSAFREADGCGERAIQSDREVTSDQERAEEIPQRTGMARPGRDCRFEQETANRATCAMVPRRRQNRDWIDRGKNDLDTRKYRRGKVDGSVGFVERGLGQVWARQDGRADRRCRQKKDQS
jgi:hypothetical protein